MSLLAGSYRKQNIKNNDEIEELDARAEALYSQIIDKNGNLINEAQLHIIIAILNIDVCDLLDK